MKKLIFLFAILICNFSFSQVTISGNKLMKDGQAYKLSNYKQVFSNTEAQSLFAKARTNSTVGNIIAGLGGGFMGFGLARALSGGDKTVIINGQTVTQKSKGWELVGIGAGLVGIGIPFALAAKKNTQKALELENGTGTAFQPYFKIETAGTGLALSYNF